MNETQLEECIRAYGKDILRFCRITAGNTEDGDELYQDTMLLLLEKQEKLEPRQEVKGYALSIALKLWKNRRRKQFRRQRLVPQDSLEELAEQGRQLGGDINTSPEEAVLRDDLAQMVRRLVEQLPDKYRLPLQLFYSADLPIRSIATVLSLPENTVKSRLHRGKEMVYQELEAMGYDR